MDTKDIDVLICGAGATGLTLALDLARRGIAFRIIDRLAAPFPGSRGKSLQPRTLEVFEDLGVLERVMGLGSPYPPKRAWAADGSCVDSVLVEPRAPTAAEPYGEPLLLAQFMTEGVLRARLRELGHGVEFGVALERLDQDADAVRALLRGTGGSSTVRARYLVGADGGRSTVRHVVDIDFPGAPLDACAAVADVQLGGLARDAWHVFNEGAPDLLALCPLPGTDLFSMMAALPCDAAPDLSAAGLAALIGARSRRTDIAVGAVPWASTFRMGARLAARYRSGRVFLAGDAAHVHPPAGAQGLNTSVQDAYNLGWKLAAALAPGNAAIADALLDSYEAERRPVGADLLALSTRLLQAAQRGDLRRDRAVRQLDLAYRASPLAFGLAPGLQDQARSLAHGLAAGDRAPDAPLRDRTGQPTRLFDLFAGPHWTLLGRDGARAGLARLERPGLHVHIIGDLADAAGHVAHAYALAAGEVVLVRPDGYVGARVATTMPGAWDALAAYLRQVGLGTAPALA
jgi:2-polyprenyl-6-methoxyphenol hydroxylase-like FAD-dependent oxidoreductase